MSTNDFLPIFIGSEQRIGKGKEIESIYPADQKVIAKLRGASLEDVNEAIDVSHKAFLNSGWKDKKPHERASVLFKISQIIKEKSEYLAQRQLLDNGKPINETRNLVASSSATFQYFASCCEALEDSITPSRGDYLTMSIHEPMGVIAAITPWNSPIASETQKLAPALASGCAVILKPAGATPLLSLELASICYEAGIPKDLISVLPGSGSSIGDAIVKHKLIKRVSFTGGTTTGKNIAKIAAEKMMPISMELGGKSATIVFEDAQIEHAINGVIYGIFSSSGESCIAGSRLFIAEKIYSKFIKALVEKTKTLRVGNPKSEETQIGPLITQEHREYIENYVSIGLKDGGKILVGGKRPEGVIYEQGNYYLPTIIEGLSNKSTICQEEIFGPVLVVLPFKDEEDLIKQVNDSLYALASGIWTSDYKKAYRVAKKIQAGTVWINTYKQFSISTPFGGFKDSGLGREKGIFGIRQYMEQKSLYWGLNENPISWAD